MERSRSQQGAKLVFVYNADSGLLNLLVDAAHRVIRPSTYPCRLCAVTYSLAGMRSEWKTFVQSLGVPVEFLHRDELRNQYGIADVPLPAAFIHSEGQISPWISATEINDCRSIDELKQLVRLRLDRRGMV